MRFYLFLIGLFVLIIGCKNEDKKKEASFQFKEFYYPIDELSTGKVYVYTPVDNDSLSPYYWYFLEQGGYFIGTKYNADIQVEQITTEDILHNGTAMHRLQLCDYDEREPDICRPIAVNIEAPAVFPFEMQDASSVFLFKIDWQDDMDYSLIRNRHFIGYETRNWKGKDYECIRFGIKEEISVGTAEIGYQTFKGFSEEVYAKGIGLIYSIKRVEGLPDMKYELADTMTMQQLEKMFLQQ